MAFLYQPYKRSFFFTQGSGCIKTEMLDNNTMSRPCDNINHVEEVLINISLCVEPTLGMAFIERPICVKTEECY